MGCAPDRVADQLHASEEAAFYSLGKLFQNWKYRRAKAKNRKKWVASDDI
jgi:hypothetical protein